MSIRGTIIGLGVLSAFAWLLSSCELTARDGQLSCAASACPDGMYCYTGDQRCYSLESGMPYNDSDNPWNTGDGGLTGDTGSDETAQDECPEDPEKTKPGQCGCGVEDEDLDEDGIADCNDDCPTDPDKEEPELCGCGYAETTCALECEEAMEAEEVVLDCGETRRIKEIVFASYGNPKGTCKGPDPSKGSCHSLITETMIKQMCVNKSSCKFKVNSRTLGDPLCLINVQKNLIVEYFCREVDSCPGDPDKLIPGICGCGKPDVDSDGDGTMDCLDKCPNDPGKTKVGKCGCGKPDVDTDGDRVLDCKDECPSDSEKSEVGECGCGIPDVDSDKDGTFDCKDKCIHDPNKNAPGVCGCGRFDSDTDRDGTLDCEDMCPLDPKKAEHGICGCGIPDVEVDDPDGDGVPSCLDKCPNHNIKTDPGQCGCAAPDVDDDGDGTANCVDQCPRDPNKAKEGQCGCGAPDIDEDNDGYATCLDECPADPGKTVPGICGCGTADTDSDGDATANCFDQCPHDPKKITPGVCGCGQKENNTDSDADGTADCVDKCPNDPNKNEPGLCGCGSAESSCAMKCVEAGERENATLDCGINGRIDSFEFASFGDPEGSCDGPDWPSFGTCNSSTVVFALVGNCYGRSSCTLKVENAVLGDPHCAKSIDEKLLVEYLCRY